MSEWLGRTWQAADLQSSSKHAERARPPPGDHCPPVGAVRHDHKSLGESPATALLVAKTFSSARMGKGRQNTKSLPSEEEQGGGIHLLLLHPSSRDEQEELGNPPEDTSTFLPGSWAGAATTPAGPLRQPDLQPGVKVGLTCRGWRHRASLPRAEWGKCSCGSRKAAGTATAHTARSLLTPLILSLGCILQSEVRGDQAHLCY